MKSRFYWLFPGLIFSIILAVLSACQRQENVCPPVEGTPGPKPILADLLMADPTPGASPTPSVVKIGGKQIMVDRLISGPFCNDNWSGIVYVGCDAQTAAWNPQEQPLFLLGCNLNIEEGTVVYVAAHNDTAYYKGCSCHTGEEPIP